MNLGSKNIAYHTGKPNCCERCATDETFAFQMQKEAKQRRREQEEQIELGGES